MGRTYSTCGSPPPTQVGDEIVAGSESEQGLPTRPSRRRLSRVERRCSRPPQGGTRCPRRRQQPGGPDGPLECRPLEDGDVRLACVRRRRFRARHAGTKSIDPNTAGPGVGPDGPDLDAGFKRPAAESVLIQSRTLSTTDAFTAAVGDVVARLSKLEVVQNVRTGQVSPDGHSALVEFEIRGAADEAAEKIDPVLAQVDAAQKAHPQLYVGEFGMASAVDALAKTVEQDLGKAGMLSLRSRSSSSCSRSALSSPRGIPLLLALTAVFATFGVVAGPATSSRWRTKPARSCS